MIPPHRDYTPLGSLKPVPLPDRCVHAQRTAAETRERLGHAQGNLGPLLIGIVGSSERSCATSGPSSMWAHAHWLETLLSHKPWSRVWLHHARAAQL